MTCCSTSVSTLSIWPVLPRVMAIKPPPHNLMPLLTHCKGLERCYAIQLDWLGGEREWFTAADPEPFQRRWRFEWEFGAADRRENIVQAPEDSGTPIDLAQLDDVQNPTWYSRVTFERHFEGRHELALVCRWSAS